MKNYIGYIIAIIILLFFLLRPNQFDQIFEKENIELKKQVKLLDQVTIELAKENDSLAKEIDNRKEKIVTIIKYRNEKIRAVDTFTVSQYQKFFTDRYAR